MNDGISESICSLSYIGVNEAVGGILQFGTGAYLAKVDIKSAYRHVPIHPDDRWLMGMLWDGALFIDAAHPFGLRSAPKIFSAVADAAEWIQPGKTFIHRMFELLGGIRRSHHHIRLMSCGGILSSSPGMGYAWWTPPSTANFLRFNSRQALPAPLGVGHSTQYRNDGSN